MPLIFILIIYGNNIFGYSWLLKYCILIKLILPEKKKKKDMEKEMTTHSSILAWRIPWTEDRGRLQSMGSQRVGYD